MEVRVTVFVHAGKNLAAKDITGKSDPYVVMRSGTQHVKSKVIKNTLDPKWQQEITLVASCDGPECLLEIEVWDKDMLSADDFMGRIEPIELVKSAYSGAQFDSEAVYELLPDTAGKHKVSGELVLSITIEEVGVMDNRTAVTRRLRAGYIESALSLIAAGHRFPAGDGSDGAVATIAMDLEEEQGLRLLDAIFSSPHLNDGEKTSLFKKVMLEAVKQDRASVIEFLLKQDGGSHVDDVHSMLLDQKAFDLSTAFGAIWKAIEREQLQSLVNRAEYDLWGEVLKSEAFLPFAALLVENDILPPIELLPATLKGQSAAGAAPIISKAYAADWAVSPSMLDSAPADARASLQQATEAIGKTVSHDSLSLFYTVGNMDALKEGLETGASPFGATLSHWSDSGCTPLVYHFLKQGWFEGALHVLQTANLVAEHTDEFDRMGLLLRILLLPAQEEFSGCEQEEEFKSMAANLVQEFAEGMKAHTTSRYDERTLLESYDADKGDLLAAAVHVVSYLLKRDDLPRGRPLLLDAAVAHALVAFTAGAYSRQPTPVRTLQLLANVVDPGNSAVTNALMPYLLKDDLDPSPRGELVNVLKVSIRDGDSDALDPILSRLGRFGKFSLPDVLSLIESNMTLTPKVTNVLIDLMDKSFSIRAQGAEILKKAAEKLPQKDSDDVLTAMATSLGKKREGKQATLVQWNIIQAIAGILHHSECQLEGVREAVKPFRNHEKARKLVAEILGE